MNVEKLKTKWFGAIRTAADEAVAQAGAAYPLNDARRIRADMLIRQFLCDRLPEKLMEVEGFDADAAEAIRRDVYSGLIEDALAGSIGMSDDMSLVMFLHRCTGGVADEAAFCDLFKEALGPGDDRAEDIEDIARQARQTAADRLDALTRKKPEPPPRPRRDDEPPPWLDEFEYIDWMISH